MTTYKIKRFFKGDFPAEILDRGLTLEQAQAHCNDPESSSKTAVGSNAAITKERGEWFDGYEQETR